MLCVKTLTLGQLETNCYIVYSTTNKEALIIDPGENPDYVVFQINDLEVIPKYIVTTHGHFDHIGAVNELKLAFNIPLYANEKDEFLLARSRESSIRFTQNDPGPAPLIDKYLEEGDTLLLDGEKIRAIHTPGHTPGSISLYIPKILSCFVGDLFFADGTLGEYTHNYSDKRLLENSVQTIIDELPGLVTIYPGHGSSFKLGVFQRH